MSIRRGAKRARLLGCALSLRIVSSAGAFVQDPIAGIAKRLYGRRRVGKSARILRFLQRRPGLYYVGKSAPKRLQMKALLVEAGRVLDAPLLAEIAPKDWKTTLEHIDRSWTGPGRRILALDEFQWIVGTSPELPSVLQELWDRRWRDSPRFMVILCGSVIGFMEREVLGKKSPLYGRRTAQILLRPLGYREVAAFHGGWSREDQARAWLVCGGIPLYHRFFPPDRFFAQSLREQLLDEYAPLYREPAFLLREELRDVENYYAVRMAVAAGHHESRAIAEAAGVPERSLHYWIQQLSNLGYLGRRYPLTGKRPVKRHVRYVLEDPLLRFWFRFVYPNLSYLQHRGPSKTFADRIRRDLPAYFGTCFERLCRAALPDLYAKEGVEAGFEVGEYWDRRVQIDLVSLRGDRWTDLGECKWGRVRSLPALQRELASKVSAFPNPRNATIARRFFLRRLPKQVPEGMPADRWYDLEALYSA